MHDWQSFLWAADQFLVSFFAPPYSPFIAKFFLVGHTVELHLKAEYARLTNDISKAIKFSHNLADLWAELKRCDPAFMPRYTIDPSILAMTFVNNEEAVLRAVGKSKFSQFIQDKELYVVLKHTGDLKYLGAPLKSVSGQYALVGPMADYWVPFFIDLRARWAPHRTTPNWIEYVLESDDVPLRCKNYLCKILGKT